MATDWFNEAQQVLGDGESNLTDVLPSIIKRILRDGLWQGRTGQHGEIFQTFPELVEYKLYWGMECPYERLMKYCEHDKECHAMLLAELPAGKTISQSLEGNDNASKDNNRSGITTAVSDKNDRNTVTGHLKRLKRDRPELAERVIRGEMTANAAAIEAGFRKVPSPYQLLVRAWGKASEEERNQFMADYG